MGERVNEVYMRRCEAVKTMSDDALLDGSSYEYKLMKEMLSPDVLQTSKFSLSSPSRIEHPSHEKQLNSITQCPRIPNFLNSPAPTVGFVLRSNRQATEGKFSARELSITDLSSSVMEYKKEVESHENLKREELLNSQVALLEVYRNKIASNNVEIEELKQSYEQKLYQQKVELTEKHQAELEALREEERDRQFADQARIGAIKNKLKLKYETKIRAFQYDVENTRTALYNRKLQIEGSVERANREISTLRSQQESIERIHREEVSQKDKYISELQSIIKECKESKLQDEEWIRIGVEIAALVIHMHEKGRPLSTEDLEVTELYKYLKLNSSDPFGSSRKKDEASLQSIVPTAYLKKALQSSKKLIQSTQMKK